MHKSDDLDFYNQIAAKFKEKRKELRFSQEKLGEMLSVDYHNIQKWENCERKIPLDKFFKFCKIANISLDYFFDNNQEKTSSPYNPELEKQIMMLEEIYNYNDENFIYIAKNNIELAYGLLKKERKQKGDKGSTKKKMA